MNNGHAKREGVSRRAGELRQAIVVASKVLKDCFRNRPLTHIGEIMSQPEPLLKVHCLSFLYLTFAHQTDGELTEDERSVIRTKLQEWIEQSDWDLSSVDNCMDEAITWYNGLDVDGRINIMAGIAATLKDEGMTVEGRQAVLADLVSIAKSDGNYDEVERDWAQKLAVEMEVEFSD